jgi:putative hydrolase of the HAD superfamily
MTIEVVFLDIGGVLYRDEGYANALRLGLRELGASFGDAEFGVAYDECRRAQAGSFRERLARRFLGPDADVPALERHAAAWWHYTPEDLEPDALPALEALAARYRLGLIANQPSAVREALVRDGLARFFEVHAVSEDLGLEKPDPRIFAHAVEAIGAEPVACVMVGDRLDYDVRPARAAGMRAVWLLRGEAPDEPTPAQLAEPDAAILGLGDLPQVVARW